MVSGHCAQRTKHVKYQRISCYYWPAGCGKHQVYVRSRYSAACCFAARTAAGFLKPRHEVQEAAKSLWLLCVLVSWFVWGVEHGDAFYKSFQ